MPRRYPSEIRRQVVELARAGTRVAQLAVTFGMSEATIYMWIKQDRVDRGEIAGLSTNEAVELVAAKRRIRQLETELAVSRKVNGGSGAKAIAMAPGTGLLLRAERSRAVSAGAGFCFSSQASVCGSSSHTLPSSSPGPRRPTASTGADRCYAPLSSRSFRFRRLVGSSFCACRRTTSGTSSLPIPCPSNSSSIVTRDRALSSRGSTLPFAIPLIGPSTPRTAQLLGGLTVTSEVIVRSPRPIRRVRVTLEPPPGGPLPRCAC